MIGRHGCDSFTAPITVGKKKKTTHIFDCAEAAVKTLTKNPGLLKTVQKKKIKESSTNDTVETTKHLKRNLPCETQGCHNLDYHNTELRGST